MVAFLWGDIDDLLSYVSCVRLHRTSAQVSTDGSSEWSELASNRTALWNNLNRVSPVESYCIPNFDSPSIFARILDKDKVCFALEVAHESECIIF